MNKREILVSEKADLKDMHDALKKELASMIYKEKTADIILDEGVDAYKEYVISKVKAKAEKFIVDSADLGRQTMERVIE